MIRTTSGPREAATNEPPPKNQRLHLRTRFRALEVVDQPRVRGEPRRYPTEICNERARRHFQSIDCNTSLMPDDQHPSPYSPPASVELATQMPCPSCGVPMDLGDVVSSARVNWRSYMMPTLQRIFSQGRPIGKTKWGLGYRIPAYCCEQCRLLIIR